MPPLATGLRCLTALCLAAAPLFAADEPPPATSLEAGAWRGADVVLLGVVKQVTDVRAPGGALGRQVVRIAVEKVYKGRVTANSVSVIVHGQRPTLEPSRPSVPYFQAGVEERFVLFLTGSPGAVTYRMQTLFDTSDKTGPEKIAAVEAVAEMAGVGVAEAKQRRALKLLTDMLRSPRGWTKTFAARELAWLGRTQPDAFDPKTQARIRRVGQSRLTADQRFWLRRLFQSLEAAGTKAKAPAKEPDEADPWRRTWTDAATPADRKTLLTRLLRGNADALARHGWWAYRQSEPSLRRWFLRAVGEAGAPVDARVLRSLYATEEDTGIREELIRTLGLLGTDEDVAWLESRSQNLALQRPALLALARIRTEAARAALARRRDVLRAAGETDLAGWIEHLLSAAFEAAERRAGRRIGPR